MDSRIKTGDDLKCEYTGAEAKALIKIYGEGDAESAWMGAEVLGQALKLLSSVEPKPLSRDYTGQMPNDKMPIWLTEKPEPIVVPQNMEATAYFSNQPDAPAPRKAGPAPRTPGRNIKVPAEVVKNFTGACEELKANPPKTRESDPDGVVPESAIRELIKNFLPYFGENPNQMFTPLRQIFNFNKERFTTIVDGMRLERKRG